jgi:hypothetical protein
VYTLHTPIATAIKLALSEGTQKNTGNGTT